MVQADKDLYWLWICNIQNVWNATISAVLEIFGTPQEAFNASDRILDAGLRESGKINNKLIEVIKQSRSPDKVLKLSEMLRQKNITFINCESQEYPDKLRNIYKQPYGLYLRGKLTNLAKYTDLPDNRSIAIVGARNSTAYGRRMAYDIGFELAAKGMNIVSGMARGIDAEGHWGALAAGGGKTFAVLGCGVDICYPIENFDLYERLIENGVLISEYPVGSQPLAWQFPQRNRLISGISDKIIVVEAREKSGSLITVEYGLEQGKDIYAVPGRIGDSLSLGCNRLIKEGAGILTSPEHIIEELELGEFYNSKNFEKSKKKNIVLEKDLELLYSCVDYFPKSIERLMNETGMETASIYRNIISLQMMGLVEEPSKSNYIRK